MLAFSYHIFWSSIFFSQSLNSLYIFPFTSSFHPFISFYFFIIIFLRFYFIIFILMFPLLYIKFSLLFRPPLFYPPSFPPFPCILQHFPSLLLSPHHHHHQLLRDGINVVLQGHYDVVIMKCSRGILITFSRLGFINFVTFSLGPIFPPLIFFLEGGLKRNVVSWFVLFIYLLLFLLW